MNQHKNYKEILRLEEMLHNISGKEGKEAERKVLFARIEELSTGIKNRESDWALVLKNKNKKIIKNSFFIFSF